MDYMLLIIRNIKVKILLYLLVFITLFVLYSFCNFSHKHNKLNTVIVVYYFIVVNTGACNKNETDRQLKKAIIAKKSFH